MYPYTGAGTGLSSILPPWAAADGKFFDNLRDPEMRAKIKAEALNPSGGWEAMCALCGGPEGVMPVGFQKPENQQYVSKRLSEIAEMRGQDWVDAAFDLFLSEEERISTIYFVMKEKSLGKPSCSRIITDSPSATSPTRMAITEDWIALSVWSGRRTYLVMKVCGSWCSIS
jgi:N-acyl-D-aspartate/D-glutamate deacylase